jgi:4-hydroxymandelate oxidase
MQTIRLTAAQALVRFLAVQMTEIDGVRLPVFAGVWSIFGHGNVAALGEALYRERRRLPTLRGNNEQAMAHAAIAFAMTIACVGDAVAAGEGESGLAAYFAAQLDPALTWSDLEWLAEISGLPVAVKGVHRPDDAERAIEHGAAGIVVSNHGARQLDTVPATIEMLPALAEAVAGRGEVLLDGGVRRGTDVVKALALGAAAEMIGRPILWGLALDGEQGVRRTLNMLRLELREAMALCGVASVAEIDAELLAPQHRA